MPHKKELDGAHTFLSFVQMGLLAWWSIACPYPRYMVIAVWFLWLEIGGWFGVWRHEKP